MSMQIRFSALYRSMLLTIAREGDVFTCVCLSTISLMDTGSLLGLVTAREVCILQEFFLVSLDGFSCW